jgi:hypothetical protein
MPNNASRRKSHAMTRVLTRKAHTKAEKVRQLREAGVIERHGPNANINAILAAENEIGRQQEAEYAAEKASRKNNGSKHAVANKPVNNSKKPVKKWATVNTSRVMARR